jgi:hypothetical protein
VVTNEPSEPSEPNDLQTALAAYEQLWSPRIVTRVNDYDVRIAKVSGEHVWHAHDNTDGDRHDPVPDHVDATAGHSLG